MSNPITDAMTDSVVVESDPTQRTQAMIAHLCGIFSILGTGIFYLMKKDDPTTGPFVKSQIKEAFNFHLAAFVGIIALEVVAIILMLLLPAIFALIIGLGLMVVGLGVLALTILNALKANKGMAAKYPFSFRVLK